MRRAAALNVLVVEDHRDTAESFRVLLELSGHRVRVAHDGLSALRTVEDFRPDAVFIDLGLPDMDGHDLARRLRARPDFQARMIAALSGYIDDDEEVGASESGFDSHLTKPVDPDAVHRLLDGVAESE